jgi:hypothetical protein
MHVVYMEILVASPPCAPSAGRRDIRAYAAGVACCRSEDMHEGVGASRARARDRHDAILACVAVFADRKCASGASGADLSSAECSYGSRTT